MKPIHGLVLCCCCYQKDTCVLGPGQWRGLKSTWFGVRSTSRVTATRSLLAGTSASPTAAWPTWSTAACGMSSEWVLPGFPVGVLPAGSCLVQDRGGRQAVSGAQQASPVLFSRAFCSVQLIGVMTLNLRWGHTWVGEDSIFSPPAASDTVTFSPDNCHRHCLYWRNWTEGGWLWEVEMERTQKSTRKFLN